MATAGEVKAGEVDELETTTAGEPSSAVETPTEKVEAEARLVASLAVHLPLLDLAEHVYHFLPFWFWPHASFEMQQDDSCDEGVGLAHFLMDRFHSPLETFETSLPKANQ